MLYHLLYPFHTQLSVLNVTRYITFRTAAASLSALAISLVGFAAVAGVSVLVERRRRGQGHSSELWLSGGHQRLVRTAPDLRR